MVIPSSGCSTAIDCCADLTSDILTLTSRTGTPTLMNPLLAELLVVTWSS